MLRTKNLAVRSTLSAGFGRVSSSPVELRARGHSTFRCPLTMLRRFRDHSELSHSRGSNAASGRLPLAVCHPPNATGVPFPFQPPQHGARRRLTAPLSNSTPTSQRIRVQVPERKACVVLVPVGGHVEPACEVGLQALERASASWPTHACGCITSARMPTAGKTRGASRSGLRRMATESMAAAIDNSLNNL
jgi:hypothetical protein